jgi:uncharacterized coiled-coil DUF342 family protein
LKTAQIGLSEAKARIERLKAELEDTREQASASQADAVAQIAYLKNELAAKERTIDHLRRRADEVVTSAVAERAKLQQGHDARMRELHLELDEVHAANGRLSIEIAGLEEYRK